MQVISVRENPEFADRAIKYFQKHWATDESKPVYEDCINSCINAENPLPQWYLLCKGDRIIGCAGVITNDFVSRMDLYPYLCALFIEEDCRGNAYGNLLIKKAKDDCVKAGFRNLYLCSDHVGYYEHYGFDRIATGYHPWGETSGIFCAKL